MKFNKIDQSYFDCRRDFSEKYGKRELWSVIDHWPLYVGVANLSRFLAIADLMNLTLEVPGHIAEFGSWRGANLLFMAKFLQIKDPMSSKKILCFDSFDGLTTFANEDGLSVTKHGAYKGNLEELVDIIKLYELQDVIEIHQGHIQNTLPDLLVTDPALSFSFVYCDTDLFEPTKIILECLHQRIVKGGLFVFDEWNFPDYPGETLAVREFLTGPFGEFYDTVHIKDTRQPTLALRKIRH